MPIPRPEAHALRGRVALSPDRTLALVRDGASLALVRAARAHERVGNALRFESHIASVAWHATRDVCVAVLVDGTACVVTVDDRGLTLERVARGLGACSRAFAVGGDGALAVGGDDASTTLLDDRRESTLAFVRIAHARKCDGAHGAHRGARSRDGRWMAFVTRDAAARERVEVFSANAPYEGAISFRLPPGFDAQKIEFGGAQGNEILIYDDACAVEARPALEVFSAEGARRATIRGASAPSVRAKDGHLIVTCVSNEALLWIDESTWRITRALMHPLTCDATALTRIFRESQRGDGYEKRARFEQKTISCDAHGIERAGVRLAISSCKTMLATSCASHDDKILFLWPASGADADDGAPLAIFEHRKPIVDFKWFKDDDLDGKSRLVFLCADEVALYSFVPGMLSPVRVALERADSSFSPREIVGASSERANAFIVASKSKTFVQQTIRG
jgi:hypothetical protein